MTIANPFVRTKKGEKVSCFIAGKLAYSSKDDLRKLTLKMT